VLFDIKETDAKKLLEYTGATLNIVLQNLKTVNDSKVPFVIRLPIIPGVNDRDDHFLKVKDIAGKLAFCRGIEIVPYHKLGEYKYQQLGRDYLCRNVEEPSKEQIRKWEYLLRSNES
jgi:pyruvate formate lyase activating enzyme